jgi:hypothetical protein
MHESFVGHGIGGEDATDTATALPSAIRTCDYRTPIGQVKQINEFSYQRKEFPLHSERYSMGRATRRAVAVPDRSKS